MIAIPNMDKPKSCYNHCDFIAMEEVGCPLKDYAESHQYKNAIHPDCPLIDIVQCKDCKYYDTESRSFSCCTDIFGAVRYMEPDGFCSKGERRSK